METLTVGITGAKGLLGWHLAGFLKPQVNLKLADRHTFESSAALEGFVQGCDVVVHFAGMNRGDDQTIYHTNIALCQQLTSAMQATGFKGQVLFSSSTHIERDTAYGRSKVACAQHLQEWATQHGGKFCNLILPGVFGEGGKPFYNSVVSTFCHQIAQQQEPTVAQDPTLELIHAQGVARVIWQHIQQGTNDVVRVDGVPIKVSELLAKIKAIDSSYRQHIFPAVDQAFERDLFNTYRWYLFPQHYPTALKQHTDPRGSFVESVKALGGGQTSFSTTVPGITRGGHYHTQKIERFLVLKGQAEIAIRRVFDNHVQRFVVSGDEPCYVDIPTLHTHSITNTGQDTLFTLFWTADLFDPNNPDTYMEPVELL